MFTTLPLTHCDPLVYNNILRRNPTWAFCSGCSLCLEHCCHSIFHVIFFTSRESSLNSYFPRGSYSDYPTYSYSSTTFPAPSPATASLIPPMLSLFHSPYDILPCWLTSLLIILLSVSPCCHAISKRAGHFCVFFNL